MKYVNMMGNIDDFDRVIDQYISRYDIQFELASKELEGTKGLSAFNAPNPFNEPLRKAEALIEQMGITPAGVFGLSKERALNIVEMAYARSESNDAEVQDLQRRIADYKDFLEKFEPFSSLDCHIEDMDKIHFIRYRFGKMPYTSYKQFQTFLYGNSHMLFVESQKKDDHMYGVCFITNTYTKEADSVMSSFHFERIHVPYELEDEKLEGSMYNVFQEIVLELDSLQEELKALYAEKFEGLSMTMMEIAAACAKVRELEYYYELRRFAAKTKKNFYIFVGWMSEKDALALEQELKSDSMVMFTIEDGENARTSHPPTKLRNLRLFKPFEMFVTMYGLPGYNEMDPTMFIALTYTFLFGMMFGDVGQGAAISLVGFALYKLKGMKLGAIMSIIGLSSVFFGFMYGSVFGIEHMIQGIWMKPSENINTILLVSVAIGVLLLLVSMFINMTNAARQRDWGKLLFGPNGVAGIVFYASAIYLLLMVMNGSKRYMPLAVAVAVLSLTVVALRAPLAHKLEGSKKIIHGSVVLFVLETLIELLEILLGYFTNTISFVRVGAFALSHAGIMGVVLMLSETSPGSYNIVGLVVGNIIVICLEGLVVGIQALRLDFYEMFSRFYDGGGRDFSPCNAPKY